MASHSVSPFSVKKMDQEKSFVLCSLSFKRSYFPFFSFPAASSQSKGAIYVFVRVYLLVFVAVVWLFFLSEFNDMDG